MPVVIRKNDQIMMSLVHFFVTQEDYAPIKVQGVQDEIWLEKLDGPYRIIRINTNSIINDEQFEYDIFKMKHIIKQIKKKTLSFKINALNINLNMDSKINTSLDKTIDTITINSLDSLKENQEFKKIFPSINNALIETQDELEMIINVTNDINEHTEKENKKFERIFAPKKLIVTKLLILISIIMFLVVAIYGGNFFEFDPNVIALLGGNNILLVKSGEVWRLITCAFLHVGLIHLLVNMYSLAILGTQVETFIGKVKFLIIYLVSAITASLLSLVFLEENVVSAGASGAIFGLMGSLLYFGYHYRLFLSNAIKNQIIPIIILNLAIGFTFSGIDNFAHIGGLIGGYLASMAIGVTEKNDKQAQINGTITLFLLIGFLCYIVFFVK